MQGSYTFVSLNSRLEGEKAEEEEEEPCSSKRLCVAQFFITTTEMNEAICEACCMGGEN